MNTTPGYDSRGRGAADARAAGASNGSPPRGPAGPDSRREEGASPPPPPPPQPEHGANRAADESDADDTSDYSHLWFDKSDLSGADEQDDPQTAPWDARHPRPIPPGHEPADAPGGDDRGIDARLRSLLRDEQPTGAAPAHHLDLPPTPVARHNLAAGEQEPRVGASAAAEAARGPAGEAATEQLSYFLPVRQYHGAGQATLTTICEPLFQLLCRTNRMKRAGASHELFEAAALRREFDAVFQQMNVSADEAGSASQFAAVEEPLRCCVDIVISRAGFTFGPQWVPLRQTSRSTPDAPLVNAVASALAEDGPAAEERLKVLRTCLCFTADLLAPARFIRFVRHNN
jgi:hypothetical protein